MFYIFIPLLINLASSYQIVPLPYTILQENTENVIDISKNHEKRFYLHVSDESLPFFMYITPCGAPVHWQLFTHETGMSFNEEFDILSDVSNSLEQSDKFKLIAGEEDTKRMTFFAHKVPRKLILVISPTSINSSIRIFFSPSLFRIEDQYPPLPHDTRLATTIESRYDDVEARITWKIAPKVRNAESGRYRICAIIARKEPEFAGQCDHVEEGVEVVKCVPQTNNSVVVSNLRRDKQYFVSIFVRDYKRGTSSSYEMQTIQTTPTRKVPRGVSRKQKRTAQRAVISSKLQALHLEPKKGAFVNSRFNVPVGNKTQTAMLIIHACDGLVRVNIFKNGRILKRSDVFSGFRRFVITNVKNGHLRCQIVNDDDTPKTVRIWASTDKTTSPYPSLPDDTSIKVVGRTCESATIQWLRAEDENVKYCVYQRRENSNFLEHLVSLTDNLCEGGISSSKLIGCYTHSIPGSANQLAFIETTVTDLSPSSTYRFDLLATPMDRPLAQSLPYRTIWVQTNPSCFGQLH